MRMETDEGLAQVRPDPAERIDLLLDAIPETFSTPKRIEQLRRAARIYLEELNQPESALVVLQAALREDLNFLPVVEAVAELAQRTDSWQSVLEDLVQEASDCAEDAPERASRIWLRIAIWYIDPLGEYEHARLALEQAVELDATCPSAHELRARLCESQDDWEGWLSARSRLVELEPLPARKIDLLLECSDVADRKLHDLDRAVSYLERASELDATALEPLLQLERLHRRESRITSLCRALWKQARLLSKPEERLLVELEVAFLLETEVGDAEQAKEIYSQIPDARMAVSALRGLEKGASRVERATLHRRIALFLTHRPCPGETIEWHLEEALSLVPDNRAVIEQLLAHYDGTRQWGKEAGLYERLAKHAADEATVVDSLISAAQIYAERLNETSAVIRICEQVRALSPDVVAATQMLANAYCEREDWRALAPLIEELQPIASGMATTESTRLSWMAGRVREELGETEGAVEQYERALRMDPHHPGALYALGALSFRLREWQRVAFCYRSLLRSSDHGLGPAQCTEIHYQLGEAHRNLGDARRAYAEYSRALDLDPSHQQARAARTELYRQSGEWTAAAADMRERIESATGDSRARLLADLGDIEREQLNSPEAALARYREALQLQPDQHRLMQRVLDLAAELEKWPIAYEAILRFAQAEKNSRRRGQYYLAAAEICRDKLRNRDKACEHFEQCLDAFFENPDDVGVETLPRCMKAFADLDAILTRQRAWKKQELVYRRMIGRLPKSSPLLAGLWHALAEIYRSRLARPADAATALEVASSLDPDNLDYREELVELLVYPGVDERDKAIAQHQAILDRDPTRQSSYRALAELYRESGRSDAYWNLCQALVVLEVAAAEQKAYVDQNRSQFTAPPKGRIPAALWPRLVHPSQDPRISSLFYLVAEPVLATVERTPREIGVKKKELAEAEAPAFVQSCAAMIGVKAPRLYGQPKKPTSVRAELLVSRGDVQPSLVVGGASLARLPASEQAFSLAAELSRLRRENWLAIVFPSCAQMREILLWSLAQVVGAPRMPPCELVPALQGVRLENPSTLEQITTIAARCREAAASLDINAWRRGQTLTCDRVALVASGDLAAAARCMARQGQERLVERVSELLRFSASEEYCLARASVR